MGMPGSLSRSNDNTDWRRGMGLAVWMRAILSSPHAAPTVPRVSRNDEASWWRASGSRSDDRVLAQLALARKVIVRGSVRSASHIGRGTGRPRARLGRDLLA